MIERNDIHFVKQLINQYVILMSDLDNGNIIQDA